MQSFLIGGYPPRQDLPKELTNHDDFLAYLGASQKEVDKISQSRSGMYTIFSISKSDKKERVIRAPNKRLAFLQEKITILLNDLYRVKHPVHGFVRNKSVKTNALSHLRSKFLLNLDL